MTGKKEETDKTIEAILEGINRIKGKEITIIDLNTIHHTECGYFVICHGNSNTQVNAISQSVEEVVEKHTGEKAWHRDGYKNAIWILIDYGEIMVHVFQKDAREFYNLEGLWADAKITKIEAEN
ncbi:MULTISPECIES: ribosome silencing factor [Maribellus]|uniref:Ribosomal silencing factor RsfS n=1 Tax=Maribellus comscasis TaxID=2681766 RepID=A0A6I6JQF6_9BACT|nr:MULTISPECIES: ribosome silencing factor [Maribellus]MCG6186612.1 ribosome silencing factor [Maribellus maritimus]QGY43260.1 ribosome silencing factor [Maribellus comscasis]